MKYLRSEAGSLAISGGIWVH